MSQAADDTAFTYFVEQSVPEALADVIDQVRDEWDGSPFFILAIPEHEQLAPFILTGDAGADRLSSMLDAIRVFPELPIAAALVHSMPLFTTAGVEPGEGLLSIFCAHADGRQAVSFKRLYEDEGGRVAVSDAPDDVEGQVLEGATTQFMTDLLKLCGEVRAGTEAPETRAWDRLLAEAVSRLGDTS